LVGIKNLIVAILDENVSLQEVDSFSPKPDSTASVISISGFLSEKASIFSVGD
jgi:hypothetical protein